MIYVIIMCHHHISTSLFISSKKSIALNDRIIVPSYNVEGKIPYKGMNSIYVVLLLLLILKRLLL